MKESTQTDRQTPRQEHIQEGGHFNRCQVREHGQKDRANETYTRTQAQSAKQIFKTTDKYTD